LERSGGRPAKLLLVYSVVGGAEPQEGGGPARARTDWRSEGALHQCPDEALGSASGQWPRNNGFASFCFVLITSAYCRTDA